MDKNRHKLTFVEEKKKLFKLMAIVIDEVLIANCMTEILTCQWLEMTSKKMIK